jgi:complement component 1 Q subcomponent-binding protein
MCFCLLNYSQPVTKFNSFTVEDRAGEQIITMRGKYGENENVKIEATMFDGCIAISKPGNESSGQDFCLHLSLIVDISKGDAFNELEFVCSAWPNFLEVQKVYILSRDSLLARPYIGPDFRYYVSFICFFFFYCLFGCLKNITLVPKVYPTSDFSP